MRIQVRLASCAFAPEHELAEFLDGLDSEGAVVSFVGLVRPRGAGGGPLDRLFLDHHPRLTERSIEEIGASAAGPVLAGRALVRDDVEAIRGRVSAWVADPGIDLIITTGGTGFSPRDVTPEAVKPLFRREMDGFSVVFHQASLGTVGVSTLQSRAFAGQIDDTFIFCLPGSTGACRDAWDLVLAFELDSRFQPCSLAGQVPRLRDVCA